MINGASGTFKLTPNGEIDTTVFICAWTPAGKVDLIKAWDLPTLD